MVELRWGNERARCRVAARKVGQQSLSKDVHRCCHVALLPLHMAVMATKDYNFSGALATWKGMYTCYKLAFLFSHS